MGEENTLEELLTSTATENVAIPEITNIPKTTSNKKLILILSIIIATLLAVTITLGITLITGKNSNVNTPTPAATTEPKQKPTQPTKEQQAQIKKIIDAQHRLDAKDPRALGKVNAPIVIEAYTDFRCGHCAKYALEVEPKLKELIDNGTVRYEYNNLPVLGAESVLAAQASQAAANQNMFWEYHRALYENFATGNAEYTEASLIALAKKAGIKNIEKFKTDLNSENTVNAIKKELENGVSGLGFQGTPTFLIGYAYVPGVMEYEQIKEIVKTELKKKKDK